MHWQERLYSKININVFFHYTVYLLMYLCIFAYTLVIPPYTPVCIYIFTHTHLYLHVYILMLTQTHTSTHISHSYTLIQMQYFQKLFNIFLKLISPVAVERGTSVNPKLGNELSLSKYILEFWVWLFHFFYHFPMFGIVLILHPCRKQVTDFIDEVKIRKKNNS